MFLFSGNNNKPHEKKMDEIIPNHDIEDGSEIEYNCRICLDTSPNRADFIAPCSCRGSSKFVHRECLDKWRTTREDRAFSRCTECLTSYKLVSRVSDTMHTKRIRQCKFGCYVFRDVSICLVIVQLFITFLAWIVYTTDHGKEGTGALMSYFHASAYPILFYYGCGLTIFLATLGLLYFCGFGRNHPSFRSHECFCNEFCFLGCRPHTCMLCPADACVCGEGTCACCGDGAAGALSAELLPVLVFLTFLLAIVGAFVAILAGAVFLNQVVQSHVHVLQKRGLAHDFMVADLDNEINIDHHNNNNNKNKIITGNITTSNNSIENKNNHGMYAGSGTDNNPLHGLGSNSSDHFGDESISEEGRSSESLLASAALMEAGSARGSHGVTRRPTGLTSDHHHHGLLRESSSTTSASSIPTIYQITDREGREVEEEEEEEGDIAGAGLSPTQRRELARLGLI